MKLTKFIANGLHGRFKFDIEFHEDITFLTGINGSGKTTILESIEALLMPRLDYLVLRKFDFIQTNFSVEDNSYELRATNGDGKTTITCSKFPKEKIEIDTNIVKKFIDQEFDLQSKNNDIAQRFQRYVLDDMRENHIFKFIIDLPTPTLLGLDRRIFTTNLISTSESKSESNLNERKMLGFHLEESLPVALKYAQSEISSCYHYNNQLNSNLTNELSKVLLDEMDDIFDSSKFNRENIKAELKKIRSDVEKNDIFEKIIEQQKELNISVSVEPYIEYLNKAKKYHNKISDGTDKITDDKFNYVGMKIIKNNKKIELSGKIFSKFFDDTAENFKKVSGFVRIINVFFKRSKKSIHYDESGNLYYVFDDKNNHQEKINIENLSSGEKQLVIIFAHFYFNPDMENANIFMIDEPELSLHVLWQENIIDAIEEASKGTQFIFATHAPVITMHRLDHCIEVLDERERLEKSRQRLPDL